MEFAELIKLAGTTGINVVMLFLFLRERERSRQVSDSRVELLRECYGDMLRETIRSDNKRTNPPTLPE